VLAHRRIDALNPERAELALFDPAITIGVAQRLFQALQRDPVAGRGPANEALGLIENFFVTSMGGNAPFYACHVLRSLIETVGGPLLDGFAVLLGQSHGAAIGALHFLRAIDQTMALIAMTGQHFASCGDFESLFDRRFGLHFRHFLSPYLRARSAGARCAAGHANWPGLATGSRGSPAFTQTSRLTQARCQKSAPRPKMLQSHIESDRLIG
jgi:hypothetical protein